MSPRTPTETKDLDIYGAGELPWSRAEEALGHGALGAHAAAFLGTTRPDGRPHAAAVGVAVDDDGFYVTAGPGTRKARNLAANPSCTLSLRLDGIDLVVEGEAHRVTDAETLTRVVGLYAEGGWPATVDGDAITAPFSAPSAGPPPWHLYRVAISTVFGVATRAPHGASRWRFGG